MSQKVLDKLSKQFGDEVILEAWSHRGDETALVRPDAIREVCAFLKADPEMSFEMLSDITCVDWLGQTPRFEVVYHLYSLTKKHRVRLKCRVPEEAPSLPSVSQVWVAANWAEREVYDMYGVTFDDHPDLRRLLLYPEFQGHPLRKDYPLNGEQPLVEMHDPESHRPVLPGGNLIQIGGSATAPAEGEGKEAHGRVR